MKKILLSLFAGLLLFSGCHSTGTREASSPDNVSAEVRLIDTKQFKELVYNYDDQKVWKYLGTRPAIIDIYADWCPPCRRLSPLVEEIAKEYAGKIDFYKLNSDKEKELVDKLGVTNLPTLLYIPVTGQPKATIGFLGRERIISTINEILLTQKN